MNRLEEIALGIRNEAEVIDCYMNDIERLSDDEDKDYVLIKLGNIREKLRDLAFIVELMDMKI